jgi:CubicO group peptidase (beta-lactamase class C family)
MSSTIASLFDQYYREKDFAGAGLVKTNDQVRFAQAYGLAHRGYKVANTMQTKFDTASITKLFTAVAIVQLIDNGAIRLDDKITELLDLSGTAIPDDVTISHLLTHTSGIADDADEEEGESYEELFKNKPNYSIRNCIDFLPQFAYKKPKFKAGTKVSYNNCAFVLLGLVIEQATGEGYREYVERNVFHVCGMKHTSFIAKDDGDAEAAEGYCAVQKANNERVWRKNVYSYPPIGTADGGAYASVGDLDLFIRSLLSGKLLSEKMTQEMLKPQTHLDKKIEWGRIVNGYGFHFTYNKEGKGYRLYKEGSNAGVAAMLAYYPDLDTTSIILANQTCNVWKLHWEVEQLLFDGLK